MCDEEASVTEGGKVVYSIPAGAPMCAEHRNGVGYRMIASDSFALMRSLKTCDAMEAGSLKVERNISKELKDVLNGFLRYHVDGLRKLKAGEVSASLLG